MLNYDLALDAKDVYEESKGKISLTDGIKTYTKNENEYSVTYVEILKDDNPLGKKMGKYVTVEMPRFKEFGFAFYKAISEEMKDIIKDLSVKEDPTVMVIGLGNKKITPDALGPLTLDKLVVSRHLYEEIPGFSSNLGKIFALKTGVLGTTGIETLEIVSGVVKRVKPDLIVAIDSLASRDVSRLATTIQITDTGIMPGSGIGNNRKELSSDTLGMPVIGIGVPFVIDAARMTENSKLSGMFVTPKEIDVLVNQMTDIISAGINLAFHNISLDDIPNYIN